MTEEHNNNESETTVEKANEEIKKSRIDIVTSAKSLKLYFFSKIQDLFQWVKNHPNGLLAIITFILALATYDMSCHTKKLAESNNELVDITRQSNDRMEKLFVGQNKPLIGVAPISITQYESETGVKMALTKLSVVNYSGFVASNIVIDFRYINNVWISEWLKADHDKKTGKGGVAIGKEFFSVPKAPPEVLIPGVLARETFIPELQPYGRGVAIHIGQLDLEKTVGGTKQAGHTVLVRVTWENDSGHVFDEIHQYNLLCTKSGSGRSFTFIPEGIISQKN